MTRSFAELVILLLNLASADALALVAGVLQKVMVGMDEHTFPGFLKQLHKGMQRSPWMITTSTLHVVLLIPYAVVYGLGNTWFIAGGVTSIAASVVLSKPVILPTYTTIYDTLDPGDTAAIRAWRDTLGRRNALRAAVQFVSVALMVVGLYGIQP